jgi:hypothetical protein
MGKMVADPIYSPLSEIEKLSELKNKGIITNEEFQIKKRQLLGF